MSSKEIEWWTKKSVKDYVPALEVKEEPIETVDPTACDINSINNCVSALEVKKEPIEISARMSDTNDVSDISDANMNIFDSEPSAVVVIHDPTLCIAPPEENESEVTEQSNTIEEFYKVYISTSELQRLKHLNRIYVQEGQLHLTDST